MRYSTKLGTFQFAEGTRKSVARLVVDTVLGQWYNPQPGEPKLKGAMDCQTFIKARSSNTLAGTQFTVRIRFWDIDRAVLRFPAALPEDIDLRRAGPAERSEVRTSPRRPMKTGACATRP